MFMFQQPLSHHEAISELLITALTGHSCDLVTKLIASNDQTTFLLILLTNNTQVQKQTPWPGSASEL
jgi:hypothetical protein